MIIRGKVCLFLLTGVIMMASQMNDGYTANPPLMKEWHPSTGTAFLKLRTREKKKTQTRENRLI